MSASRSRTSTECSRVCPHMSASRTACSQRPNKMQSNNGRPAARNLRVLLLPPTSRDAEAIQKVLSREAIECEPCASIGAVCSRLGEGAGAVFVSEESLYNGHQQVARCVRDQPVW